MFESRLSRALMALGVAIGVGSVALWVLEVRVNLPDWMVRVAMIKLAFIASGGMLAAGALLGRHARLRQLDNDLPIERLGEGSARIIAPEVRSRAPADLESDTPRQR